MKNIIRVLFKMKRNEKESHQKTSPNANVNKICFDKILINDEKIRDNSKVYERKNENNINNNKITYYKTNKLRVFKHEANNEIKEDKDIKNINRGEIFNSAKLNLKAKRLFQRNSNLFFKINNIF